MSRLKSLWTALCLTLLVSCTPTPRPTPSATPTPPLSLDNVLLAPAAGYDPMQLAHACADVALFNLGTAIANALGEAPPKPILWTFGVNFEGFSPSNTPLGCLKVYVLAEAENTYYPISAGFPVDTCQVEGTVTFSSGAATLTHAGYIACTMDVGNWVQQIAATGRYASAETLLGNFYSQPEHRYNNFTLVAKLLNLDPGAGEGLLPIAAYYPVPPLAPYDPTTAVFDAAALALNFNANGYATLGNCRQLDEKPFYLWFDLQAPHHQRYVYQEAGRGLPAEVCDEVAGVDAFRFPLQLSTLYIGYDLATGKTVGGYVNVDEALVDPTDSKPPTELIPGADRTPSREPKP